jgi:GntR family transcriptional regulator/MocR family aminotransferase
MALTARVLLDEGDSAVPKDPHYQFARRALLAHGARVTAVAVDIDGLIKSRLAQRPPRLIAVIPAHQLPSGIVMSLNRRIEPLNYATTHNC